MRTKFTDPFIVTFVMLAIASLYAGVLVVLKLNQPRGWLLVVLSLCCMVIAYGEHKLSL